jgi:hypothetical protein
LATALLFAVGFLIAFACGYGIVRFLLPEKYREHEFFLMPTVGYAVVTWLIFTTSGTLDIRVSWMCWPGFIALLTISALAHRRCVPAHSPKDILRGFGEIGLLSLPMLVVVLWPVFYVGADTYLGAVNPDYFASFTDNYYLWSHAADSVGGDPDSFSPFYSGAGSIRPSARFSGALFAILLQKTLGIPSRTALTLSIAIFLTCLPLSVYFLSRVGLGLSKPAARLSSIFIGLSGCIGMSYLYFYVGQNAAIPLAPVLIGVLFILLTDPSAKIMWLATLLVSSTYLMYSGMVLFAAAPLFIPAVYVIWSGRMTLRSAARILAALVGCLLLVNIGMLPFLASSLAGWRSVVAQSLQGQYFLEFLTENFVPLYLGLFPYPVYASWLSSWGGDTVSYVLVVSGTIIIWLLCSLYHWTRNTTNKDNVVLGLSCVLVYFVVWVQYTFVQKYGYAVFKLAAWLQFLLAPLVAYGLYALWQRSRVQPRSWKSRGLLALLMIVGTTVIGSNVVSSLHYGTKGVFEDLERGTIVNSFDINGNSDYFGLADSVGSFVSPPESIGLAFTDAVQNAWVAYYLRDSRLSILSHLMIPGDDERLPDVVSRQVVDVYGNVRKDTNFHQNGMADSYYLLLNPGNPNSEILTQKLPPPIWRDDTFQLLRAEDAPGFAVLGRGYYRLESSYSTGTKWWSNRFRWVSEGGEVYVMGSPGPNIATRLSMVAITGYGSPDPSKNLTLYLNGREIEKFAVHGSSRVLTQPFYLEEKVNRLVFTIEEDNKPLPRRFTIWNDAIPEDYRVLSLAVSDIRILHGEGELAVDVPEEMVGESILTRSRTFDGIEPNLWLRESATLSFWRPATSRAVEMTVSVPAVEEFRFPFEIEVTTNGVRSLHMAKEAGLLQMILPLARQSGYDDLVSIEIRPEQSFTPIGYDHRIRNTVQSVRLESIHFLREM